MAKPTCQDKCMEKFLSQEKITISQWEFFSLSLFGKRFLSVGLKTRNAYPCINKDRENPLLTHLATDSSPRENDPFK